MHIIDSTGKKNDCKISLAPRVEFVSIFKSQNFQLVELIDIYPDYEKQLNNTFLITFQQKRSQNDFAKEKNKTVQFII